jgi:transposase
MVSLIRRETMGHRPYSDDLRERVIAAVAEGCSRRAAAARFAVSPASAVRWVGWHAQSGSVSPQPRNGKSRSPLEAHASWLLDLIDKEPDLTLAEIVERLETERGIRTTDSSIDRFFGRHAISFKKKDAARGRAGAARRGRSTPALEGQTAAP